MFSITKSDDPRPKLRVTVRNSMPSRPHEMHVDSGTVDGDNEECAVGAEFDDCFDFDAFKRDTADDELGFARRSVALSFNNFAREDGVFEVEYREVVIVEFFSGVEGYGIIQRSNAGAYSADRSCHSGL